MTSNHSRRRPMTRHNRMWKALPCLDTVANYHRNLQTKREAWQRLQEENLEEERLYNRARLQEQYHPTPAKRFLLGGKEEAMPRLQRTQLKSSTLSSLVVNLRQGQTEWLKLVGQACIWLAVNEARLPQRQPKRLWLPRKTFQGTLRIRNIASTVSLSSVLIYPRQLDKI
jgi:hypothetical protein